MAMTTRTGRHATHQTAARGRQAAHSTPMRYLARVGFLARGLMYIVIGWIAVEIAFGKTSQQADRTGALHALGRTGAGEIALWVLVIGFFGMALWRLSEALFGTPERERWKAVFARASAAFKAVLYAVLGYGVLEYALGIGSPPSSNQQSVDATATLMRHPGGKALVVVIGVALIASGLALGYQAWRERFRKNMNVGEIPPRLRRIVEWLGRIGGIARGIVFIVAGVFLIVAAVEAQPGQAKGIDSSLRELATTPLGPWLLVLVAIGLIMFGLFSWCEARWRRV
jgi:type IV secretory pathway VirB2 component (pilin)